MEESRKGYNSSFMPSTLHSQRHSSVLDTFLAAPLPSLLPSPPLSTTDTWPYCSVVPLGWVACWENPGCLWAQQHGELSRAWALSSTSEWIGLSVSKKTKTKQPKKNPQTFYYYTNKLIHTALHSQCNCRSFCVLSFSSPFELVFSPPLLPFGTHQCLLPPLDSCFSHTTILSSQLGQI